MSRFNVLCCWDHSMHLCPWSNSKMLEYSQFMTTCHMIIPCKALQCEPSFAQFCLHFMFSVALAAGQCSYVIPLHILSPSPVWWKTFSDKALSMAGTLCFSNIVQINATADQETFCVDFSRRWNIRVETKILETSQRKSWLDPNIYQMEENHVVHVSRIRELSTSQSQHVIYNGHNN